MLHSEHRHTLRSIGLGPTLKPVELLPLPHNPSRPHLSRITLFLKLSTIISCRHLGIRFLPFVAKALFKPAVLDAFFRIFVFCRLSSPVVYWVVNYTNSTISRSVLSILLTSSVAGARKLFSFFITTLYSVLLTLQSMSAYISL